MLLKRRKGKDIEEEALAKLVATVGELKGVGMKVGQLASYIDVDVPDEVKEALAALQSHSQPMEPEKVRSILETELGEAGKALWSKLERTPVAAASIGQVHRAVLPDGTRVAVKVQYPGIERAIENDFGPASMGARMISMLHPAAPARAFMREARARFLEECDYHREARCTRRFAEMYEDHAVITIPDVHDRYCSTRVITTTWIDGLSFEEWMETDPDQETRDRMGEAMFEFYVGSLFRHGLYNGDPHPGNYLFLDDGRIAMLDHGCTREFPRSFIDKLVALSHAVQSDDREDLHAAFVGLGMVKDGQEYDYETAREIMRKFYGPMVVDRTMTIEQGVGLSMRKLAFEKRKALNITLPGEFVLLLRIRLGLMAVLSRMGARANWCRLERSYMNFPQP